jgi:FKBP-type peptidyl-prolyl cis-trans isomerase (trigger factor)
MKINKKNIADCQVEIEVEVPFETIETKRSDAVENLGKDMSVKGFRKGHVPEKLLAEMIGEMAILEEMINLKLKDIYLNVMEETKIEPIGKPEIRIVKLAPNNPVVIKITTATNPEVTLPDYKKIAEKVPPDDEEIKVEEKEIDQILENVKSAVRKKEGGKENQEIKINDKNIKELGDFKDLNDFREKMRENLTRSKEVEKKEKRRMKIIEEIIKESKIKMPKVILESELDRMIHQFNHDIERAGLKKEDYLKQIKKTEDDLRKEWTTDAEKRLKTQIILGEIARKEDVNIPKEKIEEELEEIKKQGPNVNEREVRLFIESMLINEAVFKILNS